MEKQYKILMLCFPPSGHFNPFFCYASELAKNKNVKIIMYNNKCHQQAIEASNIEFRHWELTLPNEIVSIKELKKGVAIDVMLDFFMKVSDQMLPELVRCVDEEDIDLIIYDFMTGYGKWLVKYLRVKYEKGAIKKPPPRAIMFAPSLVYQEGLYPNSFEAKFQPKPHLTLGFVFRMILFLLKNTFFCFRHGLPIIDPIKTLFLNYEKLTICCLVPEYHPRSHLYPPSIRFVGSTSDTKAEEIRAEKELMEPLKSFLAPFPEKNPLPLVNLRVDDSKVNAGSKLIYVSLGTVINTDVEPFVLLIDGIKAINRSTPADQKYRFLMSVGDVSYATFQTMIEKKEIEIPENLLMMPKVPQLDVLKRASLYVTHSGQGGTSESIHYGVPMVCIPVFGDQPSVAYRVSDELGLGVRLDFNTFNAEDLKNAVTTVLNDKSYLERVVLFSQISRKYDGTKEATRLTIEYLQSSSKSKSD